MHSMPHSPRAMCQPPPLPRGSRPAAIQRGLALLVNPFYAKDPRASFGKHVLTPTQALTAIAAATPPDWRVRIWDENLLQGPAPSDPVPEVVGITVHLTFAERAYALARVYRRLGATVVLGGLHVTACPEEAAAHADGIAVGDGVQTWPCMLRDVAAGRLAPRYEGSFRQPFAAAPMPRRELLDRQSFLTTASLIATRGCRNRCDFCYLATRGLRQPCQVREPQIVADEFIATGEPYGVFTDNNLGADLAYLRRLCAALQPVERIWSAAVTLDVTDDPALVREMALAGCTGVFVGFESLNAPNLAAAGKRSPPPEDFARRVEIFHHAGIQVNGSFVFGFDHDTPSVFARTVDWIEHVRLECATFHILTPYPGTPLFRQMAAAGRLLHRDWRRYDTAHAVFRPARMSAAELEAGYGWAYRRIFSHGSIWRRRPDGAGAALAYLGMSYLYKRSNRFWPFVIRHRLTHRLWWPLVELNRRRHLGFRRRLATMHAGAVALPEVIEAEANAAV